MKMDSMSSIEAAGIPEFAHGLKILLFDHDTLSLKYTAPVLKYFSFNVTATEKASVAMSMISEQKDQYELVMASINMSDIDSVSFLHTVLEKDIPVILVSPEMNPDITRKALDKRATFFHKKPIPLDDLKNVWRYAYLKTHPMKDKGEQSCHYQGIEMHEDSGVLRSSFGGIEAKDGALRSPDTWNDWNDSGLEAYLEDLDTSSFEDLSPSESQEEQESQGPGKEKKLKRTVEKNDSDSIARNQEGSSENHGDEETDKKKRISWNADLHFKFTSAIMALGEQNAHPKAITDKMNIEDLSTRHVASHLQKFKKQIRKIDKKAVVTGRTSLEEYKIRNELLASKQSSLVYQQKPVTSRFGVGSKPTQSTTPNSQNRSPISVAGFNYHDNRMQNLNSRHEGLSHYRHHDTNSSSGSSRTNGWFQNKNQLPETRSFAYKSDLKRKQPLELEESNLKVSENIPSISSMGYMTSRVDSANMSTNAFQLPNEPPTFHQGPYHSSALAPLFGSKDKEHGSSVIEGETGLLKRQNLDQPNMNYTVPDSSYIPGNTFQFSNVVSVVTQEQSMSCMTVTPHSASVNCEQNYAPANSTSSGTQNSFLTEVGGTGEPLEYLLLDSPVTENMTNGDSSVHKSENALQLPSKTLAMDLEQHCTPGLTGPFSSRSQNKVTVVTTFQELLGEQTASSNAKTSLNLPANFNNGSQKLDTIMGEAPAASSLKEHQHCTPAFTFPFDSLNQYTSQFSTAVTTELGGEEASSNTRDQENLPVYFNTISQEMDALTGDTAPAISYEHQPQSVCADMSEMLEADLEEDNAPYADIDEFCKMLEMEIAQNNSNSKFQM